MAVADLILEELRRPEAEVAAADRRHQEAQRDATAAELRFRALRRQKDLLERYVQASQPQLLQAAG